MHGMSNDQIGPPILNPEQATLKESLALGMISTADRPAVAQAQYVASLFMPGVVAYMQFFTDLAIILLGWLSVSVEVFLRRDFGERYLSNIRLTLSSIMLVLVGFSGALAWVINQNVSDTPSAAIIADGWIFGILLVAYVGLCLFHRWQIRRRNRLGIQWYSMSFGSSWIERFVSWDDWTLCTVVEPLFVFALAVLTFWLGLAATALWLLVGSIALFLRNQMVYMQNRDRILNLMDSRIEAGFFQSSLNGAPKRTTAGFSVVPFPPAQIKVIEEMVPDFMATAKAIMADSPPGMGSLMTTSLATTPTDFMSTVQGTLGKNSAPINSVSGEKSEG